MGFYNHQIESGDSFGDRIGPPDEFDAGMGRVVESFSYLEGSLRNLITLFLDVSNEIGLIITAELSHKGLIHLASSLFKYKNSLGDFCVEGEDCAERFKELMALCSRSEELRNRIVHSSYVGRFRVKTTAKAKAGLKTIVENIDADKLLDIADFIVAVGMNVEALPLKLNLATETSAHGGVVRYYNGDQCIAVFGVNSEPDT